MKIILRKIIVIFLENRKKNSIPIVYNWRGTTFFIIFTIIEFRQIVTEKILKHIRHSDVIFFLSSISAFLSQTMTTFDCVMSVIIYFCTQDHRWYSFILAKSFKKCSFNSRHDTTVRRTNSVSFDRCEINSVASRSHGSQFLSVSLYRILTVSLQYSCFRDSCQNFILHLTNIFRIPF